MWEKFKNNNKKHWSIVFFSKMDMVAYKFI